MTDDPLGMPESDDLNAVTRNRTPLTSAELRAMRERHSPSRCPDECGPVWPCESHKLLDLVDALRAENTQLLQNLQQLHERCAGESCREQRDHRQLSVQIWVRDTFGERTAVSVDLRAARFIEEAIEAVQSAGLPLAELERVARFVYAKPAGELRQELGGVGLTLLAFAAAAGVSADDAESAEFARVLAKGAEHFRQRDQLKADAGLFSQLSAEVPHAR